ncbi:MAG: DNA/RNA non-specific endonuclease [Bacteroidales bacterium]|nr:DNA/RNA non-specific endonuclease [Bacteroidales bacterium]
MNRFLIYSFILCVSLCSCSHTDRLVRSNQTLSDQISTSSSQRTLKQFDRLEYPSIDKGEDVAEHLGFTSSYNHQLLLPNWVAYELTAEETQGNSKGKESFSWDPKLSGRQANREDYKNDQQWDKGHMAPKADMKWSTQAYEESFYLSNICPQNHTLNARDWLTLENLARRMATKYGKVYIICGPIVTSNQYGTLGESEITIPDMFFKALLVPKNQSYSSIAFVMQNNPDHHDLSEYAMTVDSLERLINKDLFHFLNNKIEKIVESQLIFSDWV